MATPTLSLDERVLAADAALEVAVSSLLAADQHLNRVQALDLLVRRAMKRRVNNRVR